MLRDEGTRQKLLDAGDYSLEQLDEMMAKGDKNAVLKVLAVVGAVDADMLKNVFGENLPPGALDKQVQSPFYLLLQWGREEKRLMIYAALLTHFQMTN